MPDIMLMSGRELRPCRTFCPAEFNTHKMSDKENKNIQINRRPIWFSNKMTNYIIFASHQLGKMSDSGSKCPAERWGPAGHLVRHTRNNFRDHCNRRQHEVKLKSCLIRDIPATKLISWTGNGHVLIIYPVPEQKWGKPEKMTDILSVNPMHMVITLPQ